MHGSESILMPVLAYRGLGDTNLCFNGYLFRAVAERFMTL